MAAIEPKFASCRWWVVLLACTWPVRADCAADRAADVRSQVTYVASALAGGNPTDALIPFDRSFPDYDKLSTYFAGLTDNYDVVSEILISDEDDGEKETVLKANWTLDVADKVNSSDVRRAFDVTIHLRSVKGKWKIFGFTPIEMFNPQLPARSSR